MGSLASGKRNRRWLFLAIAVLLRVMLWFTFDFISRLYAPSRALAAARQQWEAVELRNYRLKLQMLGWGGCQQQAEVFRERVVAVDFNTCRYYSPRSVTMLFNEAERFMRRPETGWQCRRPLSGRDCGCYANYDVEIVYNTQYGYPEKVVVDLDRYEPNRMHADYWRYLMLNRREPSCGGPVEPAGRHLRIEAFEPLP